MVRMKSCGRHSQCKSRNKEQGYGGRYENMNGEKRLEENAVQAHNEASKAFPTFAVVCLSLLGFSCLIMILSAQHLADKIIDPQNL